jgi:hypothetical protein
MAKNSTTGNTSKPSNPFTILSNSEISSLHKVLDDLNIMVGDVEESVQGGGVSQGCVSRS